jgi:hypothetical protein
MAKPSFLGVTFMNICSQCGNNAIYDIGGGHLLCVDCYSKLQQAEAFRQQAASQQLQAINSMQNYLSDMMAYSMGLRPSLPKREIPNPIHAHINNPTLNNMNIENSNIGLLNMGSIENVKSIAINLATMSESGASNVANELARLAKAVVENKEIDKAVQNELLDQLKFVTQQATLPPDGRALGLLKPVISSFATCISSVGSLAEIWSLSGDLICAFFGIENPFKKN